MCRRVSVANYLVLFAEHRVAISRGSGSVLFPVACLHYPPAENRERIEETATPRRIERRSRHVTGRVTGLAKRIESPNGTHSRRDRHRHGCKILWAIRLPCASVKIRSIHPVVTVGRRSLKSRAIFRDPRRALGNELGWVTIPFQGIVFVGETIFTIIRACQVTCRAILIRLLDVLRRSWSQV